MKLKLILTLSVLIYGCASPSLKTSEEGIPFIGTAKVNRYILENGLKILTIEDNTSPTFAYYTYVNVGARDELSGKTGIAHLFEHLLGRRTKRLKDKEFDTLIDQAGAQGKNASTSWDYTSYYEQLPSEKFEFLVDLEAERFKNIILDEAVLKNETEVVHNEKKFRIDNNPSGIMFQKLMSTAFKKHPYRNPIIGYMDDLDKFKVSDLTDFYKTHYSPNNTTIVVVGDVPSREVLNTISKYYGKMKSQTAPARIITAEPKQTSIRRRKLRLDIPVENLLMGFHIPQFNHPDTPAIELIQGILSTGRSSRLRQALVEKGITTSVSAGSFHPKDPSLFIVSASLQKNKRARLAEAIINRELNKLKKGNISDSELRKAKNQTLFDFYGGLTTNGAKASSLGRYETVTGDFRGGAKLIKDLEKVTRDDIKRVAKLYFSTKNSTVISGVPKK